jgi:hypothetical protein
MDNIFTIQDIIQMPKERAAEMLIAAREVCGEMNFHKLIKSIHSECRSDYEKEKKAI